MAKRVQRYRVSGTVMATLIGLVGELIVNTTNNSLHVHDGVTEGGFELGRADASNIQNATTSQSGRMTSAQVAQLDAATAGVSANAAAIAAETAARISADNTLTTAVGTANSGVTNLNLGKFALNTEPVLLSFYQSTIPTGWTLDTSFDDRVPLVETTSAQGGATGGSWTITGLAADSHTHGFTPSGSVVDTQAWAQGSGALGSNGYYWADNPQGYTFTGNAGNTGGPSTSNVTHSPSWRPLYVKVIVLSRSAWSA